MALTKADYEKVLGKSITDAEFKSLTQSRNQDPFASGTTDDPKLINTPFLTSTPWTAPVVEKGVGAIGKNAKPKPPSESKGAVAGHSDDPKLINTPFLTSTPWTPAAPYAPVQTGIGAGVMGKFHAAPTVGFASPHNVGGGQGSLYVAPTAADWPPPPPQPSSLPVQKAGKMIDGSSPSSGPLVAGMSHAPAWQYEHQQGGAPIIGTVAGPVADGLLYAPPPSPAQGSFGMVNREGDALPPRVDKAGVWWQPPMVSPTSDETAAKAKKKAAGG